MCKKTSMWLFTSCIFVFSNFAYADKQPQTEQEKVSYALGVHARAMPPTLPLETWIEPASAPP